MIVASLVSMLVALGIVVGVSADATYHTQRYQLTAVGSETGTGTVINAHANGPQVAANEQYLLIGAQPNTAYQVQLVVYAGDTTCTSAPTVTVPSEIVQTNGAGNGHGRHRFTPADVDGLHGATVGIVWQFMLNGQLAYQTGCETVILD
jgi:hypothetical protein